jgi:uncharacterized delta-60 repeat protein
MSKTQPSQQHWLLVLLFLLPSYCLAQVSEEWVRRFDGDPNTPDAAFALAVDTRGNVYVTGWSTGSGTGNDFFARDYATIKYDKHGRQQWVARYNGPGSGFDGAVAVAVDAWGNVYVTGQSSVDEFFNTDYATIKYEASGKELWVRRYNGPFNNSDLASALVLDEEGNVYVTGESISGINDGGNTVSNFATVKYTPAGVEQWVAIFDDSSRDRANAIGVDARGNVYVTGFSGGADEDPDNDYITLKYDKNGVQQWVARFVTPGTEQNSSANALALDSQGNVYVTGQCAMEDASPLDYATVKYSTHGVQQWVAGYDGPGNAFDGAQAIGLDALGNVYVTGVSRMLDLIGGYEDFATIKYNANGVRKWVERYNGPGDQNKGLSDQANALGIDHLGNVTVTGSSTRNETGLDYVTIQYDENGDRRWKKVYNGPGNGPDIANALIVDKKGNVYVTGGSDGSPDGFNMDFTTIKYDKDGHTQWVRRYNGPANRTDEATAIAVDNEGNVYVTGGSNDSRFSVNDYATVKYNAEGVQQWAVRYNGPGDLFDDPHAIVVDKDGNVYVTGRSWGNDTVDDYATIKYDKNGVQQWVARYDGTGNSIDGATALAVDDKGNVYVTGESRGSENFDEYATIKYNASGNVLWVRRTTGSAKALALDKEGNVYVTGANATIKYDANGVEQWAAPSSIIASALALEKEGNVYVTGFDRGNEFNTVYATV